MHKIKVICIMYHYSYFWKKGKFHFVSFTCWLLLIIYFIQSQIKKKALTKNLYHKHLTLWKQAAAMDVQANYCMSKCVYNLFHTFSISSCSTVKGALLSNNNSVMSKNTKQCMSITFHEGRKITTETYWLLQIIVVHDLWVVLYHFKWK